MRFFLHGFTVLVGFTVGMLRKAYVSTDISADTRSTMEFHHVFKCKGIFKYLVLYTLKDKPLHGYAVMKEIEALTSGLYTPSPGIIYPTLQLLEDLGLVEVIKEDRRKLYKITKAGLKELEEHLPELQLLLGKSKRFLLFLREVGGENLLATMKKLFEALDFLGDEEKRQIRGAILSFSQEVEEILSKAVRQRGSDSG